MPGYYNDYTVDFDLKNTAKCPLHDEDTPSFRHYDETNTYFCFGCRSGGDIISLHRNFTERMNGTIPSFEESVDFLYRFFVSGTDTQKTIIKTNDTTEEYKSSIKDLVRLSDYCFKLEGQLLIDKTITEESKRNIWKAIDLVNILVSKNLVNAIESIKYIKGVVKENIR